MKRFSAVLGAVAIAAAASLAGAVAAPAAALASHPILLRSFYADSGDRCPYGIAEGFLAWRAVHPPELPAVDLRGTLVDRPLDADPGAFCPDDGRFSAAMFTAYLGERVVDTETVRVDNAVREFKLTLGDERTSPGIDRVVVQVCRSPLFGGSPSYCGKPQTHYAIGITPGG